MRVGTPPQWIDVGVSTVSSETWVVGAGGCTASGMSFFLRDHIFTILKPTYIYLTCSMRVSVFHPFLFSLAIVFLIEILHTYVLCARLESNTNCISDTQCEFTRGGVFNPSKSSTWQNSGFYELGADKQLGNEGYGQYGLDKLTFGGTGITVPSAIIGAFNGTGPTSAISYLLGLFGLGVVPGGFNNTSPLSALSALVETDGAIPSHSWGYTAGAKYRESSLEL